MAISSVSINKTPQAGDDYYFLTEDQLISGSYFLDVMSNDLGGKAKSLFSLDDGVGKSNIQELLSRDTDWDKTPLGNQIRITGGQIEYKPAGDINHLAEGQTQTDTFRYAIQLGNGTLSWATVSVTITGTNDTPTVTAALTASADEGVASFTKDLLSGAKDADDGETATLSVQASSVTYSVDGGAASTTAPAGVSLSGNTLTVDPSDAAFDHLAVGVKQKIVVSYNIVDVHGATVAQTETITITGTNDGPVAVADVAAGTENQTLTIDVLGNDTDVDDGHVFTLNSGSAPDNKGSVSVVDKKLVFNPGTDFDHLAKDATETVTLSYEMQDEHGAKSTSTVVVTITGTNDAAVITGTATGTVVEAGSSNSGGTPTASGDLLATDVDNTTDAWQAVSTATASTKGYGTFILTATGVWTYTLDNTNSTVNALNANSAPLNDSFVVKSQDGTEQTVNIVINGADDSTNSRPTDISLVMSDLPGANNLPGGSTGSPLTLGTFHTTDPNAGDTFNYQLTSESSSGFSIGQTSGILSLTTGLAVNSVYTLNVISTDQGGLSYQETFNIITGTNQGGGQSGDDTLGTTNSTSLYDGDDVIYGSGGNDYIYGGSGNDTIFGQNGVDRIYGGAGNDTLIGGNDNDTFVFLKSDGGGVDTIKSFDLTGQKDSLDIHDLLDGFNSSTSHIEDFVHLVTSNGNTTIQVDSNGSVGGYSWTDLVVLEGVNTTLDVLKSQIQTT
jgi:VCBS repeat-containing protein